jgi:hypothetical protein
MADSYVAPTAQGSGNGTSADNAYAFTSLSSAESDAGSGGIVYFTNGTYTINTATTNFTSPGITYKSLQRYGAKFTTTNLAGGHSIYFGQTSATGSAITVDGLVLENLRTGIYNHVKPTIQFCKFTSTADLDMGEYIFANGGSAGYNFHDNSVSVSFDGSNNLTLFYLSANASFERNSFYFGLTNLGGSLLATLPSSGLKNNIWMSDNASAGVSALASASTYSCFYQIGSNNTSGGANNIFVDPQFVDPTNDDLRLRPSSPCISAGTAS